jgi:shikimate dehydrogenase
VIGAVNVILNSRGVLYGDNTDGRGFLRALQRDLDFSPEGATVALLGAGGSARAIAHTLAEVGAKRFFVLNRTVPRAEKLAQALAEHAPSSPCQPLPLDADAFSRIAPELDLVIDATTPGAENPVDELPVDRLPARAICSDINYTRPNPPLIARAAAAGLRTQIGTSMLVHQGALSLMLLTGISIRPEELEAYIRDPGAYRGPASSNASVA